MLKKKSLFIIILSLIFFASPFLILSSYLSIDKKEIEAKIFQKIDDKNTINGNISLKTFPRAKLIVEDINFHEHQIKNYKITGKAKKAVFGVSLIGLLFGKTNIYNVSLYQLDAEVTETPDSEKKTRINVPYSVNLVDAKIKQLSVDRKITKLYQKINLKLDDNFSTSQSLVIKGSFFLEDKKYSLNSNIIFILNRNFIIKGDLTMVSAKMFFDVNYNAQDKEISGNVEIESKNIKKFIFNNLQNIWYFYPDNSKYFFNSSFDFKQEKDKLIISNGLIKGDVVAGNFQGEFLKSGEREIKFNLDSLSIDEILTSKTKEAAIIASKDKKFNSIFSLGDLTNDILFEGNIKQLIYQSKAIGPLSMKSKLNTKKIISVESFNFSITGEDKTNITGILKKTGEQHSFIGKIISKGSNIINILNKIYHKKIEFSNTKKIAYENTANFELAEDHFKIYNILLKLPSSEISGEMSTDLTKKTKRITSSFLIKSFDFDDFLLKDNKTNKNIINYVYDKLSNREDDTSLLKEVFWLRDLYSNISYNIKFVDSLYNQELFEKIFVSGRVRHRYFNIDKVEFLSKNNDFDANGIIDIKSERPNVIMNINARKMNLSFLQDKNKNRDKWSRELVNIPNFKNMNMKFTSRINKLKYDNLELKKTNLDFSINNQALRIKKFNSAFGRGIFNITGDFILDDLPTLNLTYKFTNIAFEKLISNFIKTKNLQINGNLIGNLTSYGNTTNVLVRNIEAKNTFNLTKLVIDNLTIKKLSKEIVKLNKDPRNAFKTPSKELITQGRTIFRAKEQKFNITKGNIIFNNINLKSNGVQGICQGIINLSKRTIRMNGAYSFYGYYKTQKKIKNISLNISYATSGDFNNQEKIYNFKQFDGFVDRLKKIYLQLERQKGEGSFLSPFL